MLYLVLSRAPGHRAQQRPIIWRVRKAQIIVKVSLARQKVLELHAGRSTWWQFWWIAGSWVWTSLRVRSSWGLSPKGLHAFLFVYRNSTSFSQWRIQNDFLMSLAEGWGGLWNMPRASSKAYLLGKAHVTTWGRAFPWFQPPPVFLSHLREEEQS